MTNDTPPTACLADFGFTTMEFYPQLYALQGGTLAFMAPELLSPSKYGLNRSTPTKEVDIYPFSLVILQVVVLYFRKQTPWFSQR